MEAFFEEIVGGVIWIICNVAYFLFRSRGEGGFKRIFAFWGGLPTTFLSLLLVREGTPMLDNGDSLSEEALLEQVRTDRHLREAREARLSDRSAPDGLPAETDRSDS